MLALHSTGTVRRCSRVRGNPAHRPIHRRVRAAAAISSATACSLIAWLVAPPPAAAATGTITRELWTGVAGAAVSDIPVGTAPTSTGTLTQFEAPADSADNYGQRVRGYLVPPATGPYTLWIAGDDNVQLWLSTDASPANRRLVAQHSGWTAFREWTKYPTQRSAAIPLTAGSRYYVEALHKEGEVGDSLSVGWLRPGQSGSMPSEIIPGSALEPFGGSTGQCQHPQDAVPVPAGQSIQQAVNDHPAGTAFLLGAGVHRLAQVDPLPRNRFYGQLAPDCTRLTTLTGASQLTAFTRDGNRWWAPIGTAQQGQIHGRCEPGWGRCDYPNDVYVDNQPIRHEPDLNALGAGEYHVVRNDVPGQEEDDPRVYVGSDPAGHTIEIATARYAFGPGAADVTVSGLVIEKYAIPPQMGAIGDQDPSGGWRVENNEVRQNHGTGVKVGAGSVVRGNYLHHNGQQGFGATGDGVLLEGNEIAANNYAHVDPGWEAGAMKVQQTQNLVIRGNCVHHNAGPGIWVDIENTNALIEDNTVFHNDQMGIFFEISQGGTIRDNRVGRNGRANTDWLYGANIMVSTSENADVHHNDVEVDPAFGNAITIVWQDRPREGTQLPPYRGNGSRVHDNEVTFLGGSGVQGAADDFVSTDPRKGEVFRTNSFDANTYHATSVTAPHFAWDGNYTSLNFAGFRDYRQEAAGEIDTAVAARSWSCAAP
jgi:parallel beta-helix repeat protein